MDDKEKRPSRKCTCPAGKVCMFEQDGECEFTEERYRMVMARPKIDNKYRCGHCGYEGPCVGDVSAPFCYDCGMNDKLTKVE